VGPLGADLRVAPCVDIGTLVSIARVLVGLFLLGALSSSRDAARVRLLTLS